MGRPAFTALHRDNVRILGRVCAERRPRCHEFAALLEQIAAPVSGLDLVPDHMRQCRLSYLARECRLFGGPIAKRRTEAMNGQIIAAHAAKGLQHRHVGNRLPGARARKNERALAALFLALAQDGEGRLGYPLAIQQTSKRRSFKQKMVGYGC